MREKLRFRPPQTIHQIAHAAFKLFHEGGGRYAPQAIAALKAGLDEIKHDTQQLLDAVMCLQALVMHHRGAADESSARVIEQLITDQAPHLEGARTRLLEEQQRKADGVNAKFRQSAGGDDLSKSAPAFGAKKPA